MQLVFTEPSYLVNNGIGINLEIMRQKTDITRDKMINLLDLKSVPILFHVCYY